VTLLSGTPTPNGVIDAWVPGRIASRDGAFWQSNFAKWRGKHFVQAGDFNFRPKSRDTEESIRSELARNAMSVSLAGSGAGVPEPFHCLQHFEWDTVHKARFDRFAQTGEVELPNGQIRVADSDGARLAIARQLTSGLIYTSGEPSTGFMLSESRLDALEGLVDSVEGPVLVAVFFKAEVAAILRRFGRRGRAFTGSTPPGERSKLINDWNADRIQVMAASPGSMGHGINLQLGSSKTICWFTHSFDWAQKAQFDARLVRSGQKNHVSIVSLVGNKGIDRAVMQVLSEKKAGEAAVLKAMMLGE
jgi:hypothetical protein